MKLSEETINELIYNNLHDFLKDLNLIEPINEKYLIKNNIKDNKYILELKTNLFKYNDILIKNELELNNELFNNNEILLIDDISLSNIWKKITIDKNKLCIMKYLNVIILLLNNLNNEDNTKDNYENENKKMLMNNLENLMKDDSESIKNLEDFCNNFEKNKDNNNSIFKLAEELSSELINENVDLNNALNTDNNDLMNIINNIGNKLQKKMESNSINQEELLNDANAFLNQNGNIFNDLFKNLNDEIKQSNVKSNNQNDKKKKKKKAKNKK